MIAAPLAGHYSVRVKRKASAKGADPGKHKEIKGKKKGEVKTVSLKDLEKGQNRGRKHLDSRIKKLTEKELSRKPAANSMS